MIDTIVAKIQGGQGQDPSWQITKVVPKVKAYSMCSAVQAYSCGGKLEGYINGAWETIADFSNSDSSRDKGGNGGGSILFGYKSGLITKPYTNYRLSAKSGSVYPSFCVCTFFG